jgi:hypothetical protein
MPAFFVAAWLAVMGVMFLYKDHGKGFFDKDTPNVQTRP